jgi:hypothetical protein
VKKTSGAELVRQSTAMATGTFMYGILLSDGDTHSMAPVSATRAATLTALNRHPPVPKSSVSGVPVDPEETTHDIDGPRRTGVPPSIEPLTGVMDAEATLTAYSMDAPESNALTFAVEAGRMTIATAAVRWLLRIITDFAGGNSHAMSAELTRAPAPTLDT